MKNYSRTLTFVFLSFHSILALGQSTKTYVGRDNLNGPSPCYGVTEIIINTDSTYLRKDYYCGERKSWREYREWNVENSTGKIKKWGRYYRMTEYRENEPTHLEFKLKITAKKMIFWGVKEEPKVKYKGMTLKRDK